MRRSIPRTTYAADRPFLHNLWIAKGGECSNLNGLRSSTEMSPYEAYTCSASERIRRCGAFPRASARCIRCRLVLSVRSVRLASVLALRHLDYGGPPASRYLQGSESVRLHRAERRHPLGRRGHLRRAVDDVPRRRESKKNPLCPDHHVVES